ncbi:hypothetical protein [Desulfobacterium sp. N47]|uniref:hypothetical protein n=1 Tax=Desulfobacterium sp. N47 TaxID=3115210 RepID=UPI003F4A1462
MIINKSLFVLAKGCNKTRPAFSAVIYCFLLIVSLMLTSCNSHTVKPDLFSNDEKIEKVLVLRFKNFTEFCGNENNIRCPLCGNIFLTGEVAEGSDNILTNQLYSVLEKNTDFKIIHPDKAEFLADDFRACFKDATAEINKIAEIGQSVGADAVFLGHIYRFKERVGTSYGVKSPASVAFDLHLISVSERRIIWSGHLDETQQPLFDNLFEIGNFIKRGGKWVVAEDLAKPGLEDMLHVFYTK